MSHKKAKKLREQEIKLDLGCGPNPQEGFIGIDKIDFGKNLVMDVTNPIIWKRWKDNTVSEIFSSHFFEHLSAFQRIAVINQCFRVLKPQSKLFIICPHWSSCRAYGDPTHVWPPISEFWLFYLDAKWRADNAPHTDIKYNPEGFDCNFEPGWAFNLRPDIVNRNQEYQAFAIQNYKEVCMDIVITLIKRG